MPQIPILPQQPNYTIHTSQAEKKNTAPTQTADFSEAEINTDSDDNDTRLSSQKSVEGARKEQVRKTPEHQHSKRLSRKEQATA
jgi:hypothetical protein